MASIRKWRGKYQVQVRRSGMRAVSRSFHRRQDAQAWARQMEVLADKNELQEDRRVLGRLTLGELVDRYRDTVTINKRGHVAERAVLSAFHAHPICLKRLSELRTEDFASYRDERLKSIKTASLKRQLAPIHNLFVVAHTEWGLPINENPVAALRFKAMDQRRERRLKEGELEKLISTAASRGQTDMIAAIRLAIETGMRRGELLRMTWGDIDWSEPSPRVPLTKNAEARIIPLSQTEFYLSRRFSDPISL